jgi:tetratricopeptide (TPR) repeat protein
MRVLDPQIRPEEANALDTVKDEWARRYGNTAARDTASPKRFLPRVLAPLTIAASLALAAVGVWVAARGFTEPGSPDAVVQLLLERERPFEAQLTGQPHRPYAETRAASDDPAVIYRVLASEMTRMSASHYELGRFYLLQRDFARAIPYLENAEGEIGAGAAIHNDLGAAYLESGDVSLLEKAEAEFLHALREDQTFAAAAFNLALFYERTNEITRAEAEWKRFLQLDSGSDWAMEAKVRIQRLSR